MHAKIPGIRTIPQALSGIAYVTTVMINGNKTSRSQSIDHTPSPPHPPSARRIELIEARSASSQHLCAPDNIVARMGLSHHVVGSARLVLTRKSTNLLYNRAVGFGQRSPATREDIDQLVEIAIAHRVCGLGIPLSPFVRPLDLAEQLEALGFTASSPSAKLWRDDRPLKADPRSRARISVRRVPPENPGVWIDVVSKIWRTFGSRREWFEARVAAPGWSHYVALIEGATVGAGALYADSVSGMLVGHLVDGVTLSGSRRLGVQKAIIRRRIRDGLALGCRLFCSETAPPLPRMPLVSYRNLRRQSFELAYLRRSWNIALK